MGKRKKSFSQMSELKFKAPNPALANAEAEVWGDPLPYPETTPGGVGSAELKKKERFFCQWAINGSGFCPSTETIQSIPAGYYELQVVNDVTSFVPKQFNTDNLLRLPDSQSDKVISEIEKFWTLKDNYAGFGLQYKRGFLLHGPPGSGKSSTIAQVSAGIIKKGGIVVNGDYAPASLAAMLAGLREIEPERPLVVILEDVDAIIDNFGESQVLALLDGEKSINNVIYIATTNYVENLAPRIKDRPSRFDRVIEIGMPNADARKLYLESRKLKLSEKEINEIVLDTEDFAISHLKELVVAVFILGEDYDSTLQRLQDMKKNVVTEDRSKKRVGFGG